MPRHPKKNNTILILSNKPNTSRSPAGKQDFMQGLKTIYTCCAEEALQIASKHPKIDMLLTDLLLDNNYCMPETNGVQFAQEFTQKYPKTKIVFMIP